jgi:hypothetical protein
MFSCVRKILSFLGSQCREKQVKSCRRLNSVPSQWTETEGAAGCYAVYCLRGEEKSKLFAYLFLQRRQAVPEVQKQPAARPLK